VRPEDLFELSSVSDPRIGPDGRTVAVVARRVDREANDYASAIWLVPIDDSSPARRFTSRKKQDLAPRWSPDGSRLAFVSDRERKASIYT
jgi:dipeptidyl aminopeptidase/acylaminoacyl peptidase